MVPWYVYFNINSRECDFEDDVQERTDSEQCALCARNSEELGVWITAEQTWFPNGV